MTEQINDQISAFIDEVRTQFAGEVIVGEDQLVI